MAPSGGLSTRPGREEKRDTGITHIASGRHSGVPRSLGASEGRIPSGLGGAEGAVFALNAGRAAGPRSEQPSLIQRLQKRMAWRHHMQMGTYRLLPRAVEMP